MNATPTSTPSTPRIALITGGSRGLGRSAALHLAASGWDVVITYAERADAAQETVAAVAQAGRKAVALQLDTGKSGTFAAFADTFRATLAQEFGRERFDALFNNAGNGSNVPFMQTTEQEFDNLMNIHLKGVFFLTQALVPLLADGGRILNVSSGLARFCAPGKATYATMKGGIEVLSRYLASELGPRGIRVNTLAPGAIATDFGNGVVRDNPQVNAMVAANTALGRVGQPDDIGGAVAALLSSDMGWMTGERIEVSGGMHL
ncbi:SDR family NAD(P)-dependent oxidoreductase [Cupriavidus agavae]|uniref:NAD(P)-dependent dehydrogenase (Short-subunit alcohol dehydrogenase family) n=1 Tax=Cupriavidus agavae TaxID=1001822 RepID=A0A4Q7RZR7_9BURK|nr:SDR family oxidoreductase [Cupriavidus agavae]RZT39391.1 NAD(P)-dependent dehydrogenase (short-subunit alcohol dehydrogenase family) [Cupriavidus agavae]